MRDATDGMHDQQGRGGGQHTPYEGVTLFPCSFAMISTLPCCQTPTHEYVVPRSMPMACGESEVGVLR